MYNTQEHNNFIYTFRQYKIFNKKTEKEQVIIKKKNCINEQMDFLCV